MEIEKNMPTLDLDKIRGSGKLTVGEAIERLKKDPNDPDPEIQKFKNSTEELYKSFIPIAEELRQIVTAAHESQFVEIMKSIKPTLGLYSAFATSIKSDMVGIAGAMKKIQADYVRLSFPAKAIVESIASWQAPLIYPVFSQKNDLDFSTNPIKETAVVKTLPTKTYAEELLEEQNRILKHIVRLKEDTPQVKRDFFVFDEETGSFVMKVVKWVGFNLNTQRGEDGMNIFFSVLLEILDESGEVAGQFLQVGVPFTTLINKLRMKNLRDVSRDWIKNTKSNLIHKKLKPSKLDQLVILSDYENEIDGFYLKIRLPLNLET